MPSLNRPDQEIVPFQERLLQVDDKHHLYVQQYGNPEGVPFIVLHGGPGAGLSAKRARLFDLTKTHVILFDQRGCGRSTPQGSLINNTTQDLINDIEKIRHALGIQAWHVMGASWGATLALLYGQAFPQFCLSFILRGVFLGTQEEITWSQQGTKLFYPDAWEELCNALDLSREEKLSYDHLQQLLDSPLTEAQTARAFCGYEYRVSQFMPPEEEPVSTADPDEDQMLITLARIMVHYFKQGCFLKPNQILDHMPILATIPATIIQGRYDMVCPLYYAYKLHKAWPGSRLNIIEDANHSGSRDSVNAAMIEAINKLLKEK